MSTIRHTMVDTAKAWPEGMEFAEPGGLPMGLSSEGSMTIKGLGTDHHIFKSGDTTEPIKKPLRTQAAPLGLDLPNTSSTSKTTAASPHWVRKIHRPAGPIWEACTVNNHSRFKSECHTPQAKSSSTEAKTSANDWVRKDKRGGELNSDRIHTFDRQ
jgi:hypothetical protein